MSDFSAQMTALRAQADQALAPTGSGLDLMVEVAKGKLEGGMDRTEVISVMYMSVLVGSAMGGSDEMLRGLAMAIVRLAEAGDSR